jgi:hypothetical protein
MGRLWEVYYLNEDQRDKRLTDLRKLWESLKNDDCPPSRRSFSARALKSWLPNIGVIDVLSIPQRFRIRVMGTSCVRLAGGEYTGKCIEECVSGLDRAEILGNYRKCVAKGEPVFSDAVYVKPGTSRLMVQRLLLPCIDTNKSVDSIFVAVYGVEVAGRI